MRGVAGMAVVPVVSRCIRCGARWKQHADGLCRACHRAGSTSLAADGAFKALHLFIERQALHDTVKRSGDDLQRARERAVQARNALDLLRAEFRTLQAGTRGPHE